jgi:protein CpxP
VSGSQTAGRYIDGLNLEGSSSYTESEDSITYMQPKLLTLALGGLLTLGSTCAVLAQDTPPPPPDQNQAGPPAQGMGRRGMRMDPDRQLERLTRELNLTTDQQAQIKPLLVERQQKMQALFQDQSAAPEDRRTQGRTIMEGTNNSIKAVLNDDQKQKFEAMQERMRRNRPDGGPGGAAPPPPPDGSAPQPQN